jgi:hypothetical protein
MLRSHRSGADGVVAHKPCFKTHSETLSVSDHPVRSIEVASQHFLDVASSPPHEEGNNHQGHKEVTIPVFDAFVAIDWSGAARSYDGIAVAMCRRGRRAPRLVEPRGARWTRREIAEWLKGHLDGRQRLLIGFDFAFGFPFEPDLGYLGGQAPGIEDIFALWSLIEEKNCGESDFGCMRFISDPDYASLFWTVGPKPERWIERKRRTEHACAEVTKTRPDTLYKLLHSKQVGKASITGMRVLHDVRSGNGNRVAIWPFEAVRASAIVEIYPTMFRKIATGSIAKLRSRSDLNTALAHFSSRPMPDAIGRDLSDHETDALLSATGLRSIARNPDVWAPAELSSPRVQREGWIFGVTASSKGQ